MQSRDLDYIESAAKRCVYILVPCHKTLPSICGLQIDSYYDKVPEFIHYIAADHTRRSKHYQGASHTLNQVKKKLKTD